MVVIRYKLLLLLIICAQLDSTIHMIINHLTSKNVYFVILSFILLWTVYRTIHLGQKWFSAPFLPVQVNSVSR